MHWRQLFRIQRPGDRCQVFSFSSLLRFANLGTKRTTKKQGQPTQLLVQRLVKQILSDPSPETEAEQQERKVRVNVFVQFFCTGRRERSYYCFPTSCLVLLFALESHQTRSRSKRSDLFNWSIECLGGGGSLTIKTRTYWVSSLWTPSESVKAFRSSHSKNVKFEMFSSSLFVHLLPLPSTLTLFAYKHTNTPGQILISTLTPSTRAREKGRRRCGRRAASKNQQNNILRKLATLETRWSIDHCSLNFYSPKKIFPPKIGLNG